MTTTNQKGELIHTPKIKRTNLEKSVLVRAKKDFNNHMKKLNADYVKSKGCLGLRSNDITQIKTLLDMANVIQAEQLDQLTTSNLTAMAKNVN